MRNDRIVYAAVLSFCVAGATLLLQLVQTRIYGVVFWNHLVYFIISVALLGYGISGTWLSFGPNTRLSRLLTHRNAAIGFVFTTILSTLIVPQVTVFETDSMIRLVRLLQLLGTYGFAVLPYFFGGWMLGVIFRDHAHRIHLLYFADLLGAGLGCLAFLAAMRPLGAVNLVVVCCVVVAAPVFWADLRTRGTQIWAVGIAAVCVVIVVWSGNINDRIRPEADKAATALFKGLPESERAVDHTEWNAISRIDVAGERSKPESRKVFIDGDAWTQVVFEKWQDVKPFDRASEPLLLARSPYFFDRNADNVLVIGSGGGTDVLLALRAGARAIDAVELNPTTYRLMLNEYGKQRDGVLAAPQVMAYNEEGRSFVRRNDTHYDVIMMHGIDTFAATSSGAYMLSENYLYTKEAFKDYFNHLTDDGMLCVVRWMYTPETARMFIVALESLYDLGIPNPESHLLLHTMEDVPSAATLLVSRLPFTNAEVAAFTEEVMRWDGDMLYPPAGPVRQRTRAIVAAYLDARANGTADEYLDLVNLRLDPVTDDRPFFFHFDKFRDLTSVFARPKDTLRGHWASFTLVALFLFSAIAVVLFMGLPLMARGRPAVPGLGLWLLYFSCLGVSFIFVEISLMQRFALLLGHPARSIALVLASLLIFAGVGSYLCGRFRMRLAITLPFLVVGILAAAYAYPSIIIAGLGWPLAARGAITIALVAPLGILLGMPFPSGLRAVSQYGEAAVPWMWGVNGGTTVVGSVFAIILAIGTGFTTVLTAAAAGYAVAALTYVWLTRTRSDAAQAAEESS